MHDISISVIRHTDPLYQAVWQLREDVLRKPLGMSLKNENLSMDGEDDILIAKLNGQVIGCLMLHPVSAEEMKFRQMAVDAAHQGTGVGRQLMVFGEQHTRNLKHKKITLHARMVAKPFYDKLGYETVEGVFEEVGIPHMKMYKVL